jgi:hypothetical protein
MMHSLVAIAAAAAAAALIPFVEAWPAPCGRRQCSGSSSLLTDLNIISSYWGQLSPYADNVETYFGVQYAGLPDGCQIEQVHSLQRHANRFPTDSNGGAHDGNFATKVMNWTAAHPANIFTGPLTFLNSYRYQMGSSYLTGLGATTEVMAGVQFWNR